jgi:hypothetical protein
MDPLVNARVSRSADLSSSSVYPASDARLMICATPMRLANGLGSRVLNTSLTRIAASLVDSVISSSLTHACARPNMYIHERELPEGVEGGGLGGGTGGTLRPGRFERCRHHYQSITRLDTLSSRASKPGACAALTGCGRLVGAPVI